MWPSTDATPLNVRQKLAQRVMNPESAQFVGNRPLKQIAPDMTICGISMSDAISFGDSPVRIDHDEVAIQGGRTYEVLKL
ncbi:hypothetical protein UE98_23575 [Burkholderia cenocepacia]|nr:hypothetical protein UE98_23575 [Burkholderia cenocepacia]